MRAGARGYLLKGAEGGETFLPTAPEIFRL